MIKVDHGKVNCSGALALSNEWLRRGPIEGKGSGGALTLDDWQCVGAPAVRARRVGSCERTDGTAAFSIAETR